MKLILAFLIVIISMINWATAQTTSNICVQVDCKDTIQLPQDSVALNSVVTGTFKTAAWSQVAGPTVTIGNKLALITVAKGLKPGLYAFQMTASNGNASSTSAIDSVVVLAAACPPIPPQRTVVQITISGGIATILYDDKTTTTIVVKTPQVIP